MLMSAHTLGGIHLQVCRFFLKCKFKRGDKVEKLFLLAVGWEILESKFYDFLHNESITDGVVIAVMFHNGGGVKE